VNLRRGAVALVLVVGGALIVFYVFMKNLNDNPKVVKLENVDTTETTPRGRVETWTYEDLPKVWPSDLDSNLVSMGEELFNTRGCRVCHTVGEGELVGPDLKDVNTVRDYRWALLMLLRPDSMQRYDSTARSLLKRYGVQMPDQRLNLKEAEAILHYVLWKSRMGG
jgi:mono/diheme cytochrome c family protein